MRRGEIVVDLFAGGGGASLGIEQAIGRPVDVAINHSPDAVAMHQANHPRTVHYTKDVWKGNPSDVVRPGQAVALLWASPDCFPAGTLVLASDGYRPIEEITEGDLVLTHKLRWRRVTATYRSEKQLMSIRGHGHPGLQVSVEHPFYARQRQHVWNNPRRGYEYVYDPPAWVKAADLDRGWYWATPRAFPEMPIPGVFGARVLSVDENLMWLAGRYLGDGWTRLTATRAELVITCGRHEAAQLRLTLDRWPREGKRAGDNEMAWHDRQTTTAHQFTTDHRGLVTWLREHFGHRSEAKGVPSWALGMPVSLREALLGGYLSADGHKRETFWECETVSRSLAFGIKALANSLGKTVAVYNRPGSTVIEGRTVSARSIYKLRWRHENDPDHDQTFVDGELEWCPIRTASEPDLEQAPVFNLAVEDDESYIAEGIVVHNCAHFSRAKGGKPVKKEIRDLAWVVIEWAKAVRPAVICLENVPEFRTWGPLGDDDRPLAESKGQTFREWKMQLEALGYVVEHRELKACDYGAPTIRKRLFLIARSDGLPIVWPAPSHGPPGGLLPEYRTAAECIDWSIPCPSIFERKRPLASATMRRIANGILRYVIRAERPFIVPLPHQGAERGESAPTLVQTGWGERAGQEPRSLDIEKPLGTIVSDGAKHAVVGAFLAGVGGRAGQSPERSIEGPTGTTTAKADTVLVTPFLASITHNQGGDGMVTPGDSPMPAVTSGGNHIGEVRALLVGYYGNERDGQAVNVPIRTITAKERYALVEVEGQIHQITDIGMRMLTPRELARAQGFPDSYSLLEGVHSRTKQIAHIGNSVVPQVSRALVEANVGWLGQQEMWEGHELAVSAAGAAG